METAMSESVSIFVSIPVPISISPLRDPFKGNLEVS